MCLDTKLLLKLTILQAIGFLQLHWKQKYLQTNLQSPLSLLVPKTLWHFSAPNSKQTQPSLSKRKVDLYYLLSLRNIWY